MTWCRSTAAGPMCTPLYDGMPLERRGLLPWCSLPEPCVPYLIARFADFISVVLALLPLSPFLPLFQELEHKGISKNINKQKLGMCKSNFSLAETVSD